MNFETFSLPSFPGPGLNFVLNKPVLTGVLVVFFVLYSILSGVLFYHWAAYGMGHRGILVARSLFVLVSIVLFVMAGVTITYY
ncbi:MAG: hypothetical protein AB198_01645 [Parcubacteria bacterium C7867-003]|nr:MAG: hypothetical protein AB198_01645 [Parcubacteria bacterium C7867-003]